MPDSDEVLSFSPSGRYACRQGFCPNDYRENSSKRLIHLVDFEEETNTEISLVTFGSYYIPFIYWLDDSHIGVLLSQSLHRAEKNSKGSHRPKMALYEVDFTKTEWTPIKVIYQKENEQNMTDACCFHMIKGYLRINDQDYFVYTKGWGDMEDPNTDPEYDDWGNMEDPNTDPEYDDWGNMEDPNTDPEYDDWGNMEDPNTDPEYDDWGNMEDPNTDPDYNELETTVVYNGRRADFMWLRFISKQFDNQIDVERLWINDAQIAKLMNIDKDSTEWTSRQFAAYDNKLFFLCNGIEVVIVDIGEYIRIIRETSTAPVLSELCIRLSIPTPNGYRVLTPYVHYGLMYITIWDENKRLHLKIWDLDTERVTVNYLVNEKTNLPKDERFTSLHPSGHILQVERSLTDLLGWKRWARGDCGITFWQPRKLLSYNFLPLKAIRMGMEPLQKLASDEEILNKALNLKKLPRCLREGRKQLMLELTVIEVDLPDGFFSSDE